MDELVEKAKIETDPKKQTEIAHAIQEHLIDKKKANGTYVFTGGYSGRQTNKR